jgi:tRNA (cmo5U34)-methyltransferase
VSDFSRSDWADAGFSDNFLSRADVYVQERKRLLDLLSSLYKHLTGGRKDLKVCDLGSGDGIISETLLKADKTIRATLLDASSAMLARAKERLASYDGVNYIESDFGRIIDGAVELPSSDVFVSSFAVHHLSTEDKSRLFGVLYERLNTGGCFINIETVKAPTVELQDLYFAIWSEWMQMMMDALKIKDETPQDVIDRYTDPESMNRPDTLEGQLSALSTVGFSNADCFYKNGIFAIYFAQKL